MSDTTAYTVHADTVPDDAPPGLWVDTAAKLLRMSAAEIERLTAENERLRSIPAALRARHFAMAHTDMVGDEERREGYLAALKDCGRMASQQLTVNLEDGK